MGIQLGSVSEAVGGIGALLAFGSTAFVIRRDHKLRQEQQEDEAYDEARSVMFTSGMASIGNDDQGKQIIGVSVTVNNNGKRPIRNLSVAVSTPAGREVGRAQLDFLQAGWWNNFAFPTGGDDVWSKFGSTNPVNVEVTLIFEDVAQRRWVTGPDGDLQRVPTERKKRRVLKKLGSANA